MSGRKNDMGILINTESAINNQERRKSMVGINEAFVDAKEVCRILGIGMTKAYSIIREYNRKLEAQGYLTIRGKCPRKFFEQKVYGYAECYNPTADLKKQNC